MKEYIYQDLRLIQSLISQHSGGLLKSYSTSKQHTSTDTTSETNKEAESGREYKAGFGPLSVSLTGSRENTSKTFSALDSESGTYSTHMEAYDNAYDELESIVLGYEGFVRIEDIFELIDLETIFMTFSSPTINESIKVAFAKQSETASQIANRSQRRSGDFQASKKALAENQQRNIEMILESTRIASHVLPSNCFLINKEGNSIFPLLEKNLVLAPNQTSYFYKNISTKLLCKKVGKLRDNMGSLIKVGEIASFYEGLNNLVLEMLKLFGANENTDLYMPISWYQEHQESV